MASWSDLHLELLTLIARRVSSCKDFVAFRGVCRSWRSVATRQSFSGWGSQVPWLMLSESDGQSDSRDFFALWNGTTSKLTLPEAAGRKRCLASEGWLITVARDREVNLLNPLSRAQIKLPSLKTFEDYHEHADDDEAGDHFETTYVVFIDKAVLSANPSRTSDFVVMGVLGFSGKLAFCKPGDAAWTMLKTEEAAYMDAIFFKGQFYAVDCEGRVVIWDVAGPNPKEAVVISVMPEELVDLIQELYLVESSGSLLVVSREHESTWPSTETGPVITYGTTRFQVFELNLSDGKWVEMNTLGNRALFLGHSSSFSLEASELIGIKPNRIYFTDDNADLYWGTTEGGGRDMGIYNLFDGSIEPHFQGKSYSRFSPPMWVSPTF